MLLVSLALALPPLTPPQEAARFAAPVLLTEAGAPLGRGLLYPSPALFDVDGDGAAELVLGDLIGNVWKHERSEGEDTLAWSKRERVQASDGKDLKFNNW